MSGSDREYWDRKWVELGVAPGSGPAPAPPVFDDLVESVPAGGWALDVACGRGRGSEWMAQRGLDVFAVDVSAVAVDWE
jgi:2-polyprenyl-3-methyl-5-hydroxy-6-metoxy-1,4-benzoquinol methylase